jgi:hypothetical protein
VCGWSVIESPIEVLASADSLEYLALAVSKVIWLGAGAAAIADVRCGRGAFAFLCGTSVLAIAPQLPLVFHISSSIFFFSLIECLLKMAAVTAVGWSISPKDRRAD